VLTNLCSAPRVSICSRNETMLALNGDYSLTLGPVVELSFTERSIPPST
jgi:hypothetical protein